MNETETKSQPFSLILIPVFYGFMAYMSLLGSGKEYVLFSVILPTEVSVFVITIETAVLLFLTVGIYNKSALARKVLIGYNIFVISDILFTLTFIDKEKLLTLLKDASALEGYATINLIFCMMLYWILRYTKSHKEYFTK